MAGAANAQQCHKSDDSDLNPNHRSWLISVFVAILERLILSYYVSRF
jgi:hypothetical protein